MTNANFNDTPVNLRNQLLIAMPGLQDPSFAHALVYLCQHGPEGAMGLVVNRPMGMQLGQVLDQFKLQYPAAIGKLPLLYGGPVQTARGFVLHRTEERRWESTLDIDGGISLTASMDIITDIADNRGPPTPLVILGYAGWGAGQLEEELLANFWLTVPADAELLFDTPIEHRASIAAARLGVTLSQLSSSAGHA